MVGLNIVAGVVPGSLQDSPYPRSVGILGAGFLAVPLTRRLHDTLPSGTPVSVFSRNNDVSLLQQAVGAARAASAADLAARSEVVFFLLSDTDQIEAQLIGPSGFEAGVHSPTVAVIGTALSPERLRSLAHRVANRTAGRLRLVDAPLSGPRTALLRGELSVAVGAASSGYPEIEPLMSLLGRCTRVGGIGSAQVAHACQQLMVAAAAAGLGEAMLVAEQSGLDLGALLDTWRAADSTNRLLDAALQQRASGEIERDQPASLVAGPLAVAAAEADRIGVPTRMLTELRDIASRMGRSGMADEDLSTGYRALAAAHVRPGAPRQAEPASGTGAA
jgi:2-hydroxy-3-oxopropionate reductase